MMHTPESQQLWQHSAAQLASLYAGKKVSPVEVLQAVLQRYENVNSAINAVVALDAEGAHDAARASAATRFPYLAAAPGPNRGYGFRASGALRDNGAIPD